MNDYLGKVLKHARHSVRAEGLLYTRTNQDHPRALLWSPPVWKRPRVSPLLLRPLEREPRGQQELPSQRLGTPVPQGSWGAPGAGWPSLLSPAPFPGAVSCLPPSYELRPKRPLPVLTRAPVSRLDPGLLPSGLWVPPGQAPAGTLSGPTACPSPGMGTESYCMVSVAQLGLELRRPLREASHTASTPLWVRMSVGTRPFQGQPAHAEGLWGHPEGGEARRQRGCFQKKALLKEASAGWGLVAMETHPNYLPNCCMRH